jgi:hypothetical protein
MDHVLLGDVRFGPWQRELSPAAVDRMCKEFDPLLLKPWVVSEKSTGEMLALDGKHRTTVLRRLGFPAETLVSAMVLTGLSDEEDAKLFLRLNKDRHVGPTDRFRARLIAKDRPAEALQRVFDRVPLDVRYRGSDKPNNISAVEAAEEVYAAAGGDLEGERVLEAALRSCVRAWDFDRHNTEAQLLRAMGAVVLIGGRGFSVEHMVSRIKTMRLTIDTLAQRASTKDERNVVPAMTFVLAVDVYQPYAKGTARLELPRNVQRVSLDRFRLRSLRGGGLTLDESEEVG